ncbi:MAG: glutathione synthetase [Pseudomonadota bacterium]
MTHTPLLPPCFAFGRGQLPLALMGGGLILDSGEAENTFAFRCQDRFLAYNALLGLRSVLLVLDDAHEARYRVLLANLNARLRMLSEWQGLPPPHAPAPLYVRCDLAGLRLSAGGSFDAEAAALAQAGQSVGFIANQVSPTASRLLGELAGLLRERGARVEFDAGACTRVGELALDWHNKARFLAQRPALQARDGPPWADSMVIPARELLVQPHWQALAARAMREWNLAGPPTELFLKSAQDSSGNVSAVVAPDADAASNPAFLAEVRRWLLAEDFAAPAHLHELRTECRLAPSLEGVPFGDALLAALRARQAQRRGGIALIAQPVLRPPADTSGQHPGIGISLLVEDRGARLVAANAQLYRDAQRRQFLGILLDDGLLHDEAVARFARQCTAAASVLAEQGFRGPVNFDGCLARDGSYWFTGDCNPRLTALYVPLAVRMRLAACGVEAKRVISFGYRGEVAIADPPATLSTWADAGLLFGARTQRGMLVLPNLARRAGHDLLAVNLDRAQAGDALRRMRLLAPGSVPPQLEAIHG